jgi:uncharacterized protein (TIGR02147 family)
VTGKRPPLSSQQPDGASSKTPHPRRADAAISCPSVHDYLDYRAYLKEAIRFEKLEGRIKGHRDVAAFLGLKSPGHITWILQGKRNLVGAPLDRMAKLLGLGSAEAEYFRLLVRHNDTINPEERRKLMAGIARLQSNEKVHLQTSAARYWNACHHAVVRELVAVGHYGKGDAAAVAQRLVPPVTSLMVEESFEVLENLGMIRLGEDDSYVRTDSILSAGENWKVEAIRDFQGKVIDLAGQALLSIPRERRDISTLTFSVSRERLRKISTRIQEMRSEILALVRTDPDPDSVYHLEIALFPAALEEER